MIYIALYLVIINLIAILITVYDKNCAIKNKWRTKEKTLFIIAILGGSIAMLMTMKVVRHKTKHLRFMLGLPIVIILQFAIATLAVMKYAA